MTDKIKEQIKTAKKQAEKVRADTSHDRETLKSQIETLTKLTSRYNEAWAGKWNSTADIYQAQFNPKSTRHVRVRADDIRQDLANITSIDFTYLQEKFVKLTPNFRQLRDYTLTELSFINDLEGFNSEKDLLKQITEFKWGMKPGEYIESRRPSMIVVTDISEISESRIVTPPHFEVEDELLHWFSLLTAFDNFEGLLNRLLRQLEIKVSSDSAITNSLESTSVKSLETLINRFHIVATQLRNRYDGRTGFKIEDEYDVQDLMHALLRLNYDDVRKEEYSPSYAGGSTRLDFLIKREQIVVEVKKTRTNLKDKEIGSQLILDIARYKSHPDCKRLVCFVYDPENLVVNPRGLEDDLNKSSTSEMTVEVYIRP